MTRTFPRRSISTLAFLVALLGPIARPSIGSDPGRTSYSVDVHPLLTKLGCNGGGCHGKAGGQNGFSLSLLGFEPEDDFDAIAREGRGRRIFPAAPSSSLLLRKATGQVPHGGGKILDPGSEDYEIIRRWIAQGYPAPGPWEPVVDRLEIEPKEGVLSPGTRTPLRVSARLSDGSTRDVTRIALFESNEPEVAEVGADGVIETHARGGLFAVMVRYGQQLGVFHGTVPFRPPTTPDPSVDRAGQESAIDILLREQWRRLGIEPSPTADDATFIRRATFDLCGTLATPAEVRAFLADRRPDKRARLIDALLERPEYASYFALKWADILKNRGSGYSTSRQREGTSLFASWIRDAIASNMPYDRFVTEILTATGSQRTNPPTVWYRSVRTSEDYVESVSQAFLGVRVQCAQCHHHPAERWSQDDYYGLAAVFARVGRKGGFADAEVPTSETIFVKSEGTVEHPRTGLVVAPRPLGGPDFALGRYDDPRRHLAEWMSAPDNPFFARTMANRIWAHFFGRGLIHPIDDARSTNPPSHPELLDALAREFVDSGFDVKHLIRVCCTSEAYGLSSLPNDSNREDHQAFARYYPRRLPAEVLLDAISQALGVPTEFPGGPGAFPPGTRAIDLPDEAVPNQFLDAFGRPARSSACECERAVEPSLGQAMALISSPVIEQKLRSGDGFAAQLAEDDRPLPMVLDDLFTRLYSRPPRAEELEKAERFLESQPDRRSAFQSLLWSLLASAEFHFNH